MSFELRCPQCVFVSRQLGQPTPCLLHLSLGCETSPEAGAGAPGEAAPIVAEADDYDEPFEFGRVRPTVDRPGPFSLREYVRLQLVRTRIQAAPSPLDAPGTRTQARSLSRR